MNEIDLTTPDGRGEWEEVNRKGHVSVKRRKKQKRRGKYNNRKTEIDGHMFDSRAESRHYLVLKARQERGEICDLELQPRYPIEVNGQKVATYVADFRYREGREQVVVDVKGVRTPTYRLKKKLVEALYGIEIVEVTA